MPNLQGFDPGSSLFALNMSFGLGFFQLSFSAGQSLLSANELVLDLVVVVFGQAQIPLQM